MKQTNNTIQFFWVLLGSVSAFGFALISSMLLSRYFSKEEYGTYKQVMYVYNSLVIVFTLGVPRAFSYFLPKVDKSQAKDLISKINRILVLLGGLMSITLFIGAGVFAKFLKNDALADPIRYFSLVPLFMLPTMGLEGILSTYKQTEFLAIYNVVSKIFMLLCVVSPVILFNLGVDSAIIGFAVSSFLCFISAIYFKNRPVKGHIRRNCGITYKEILNYTLPLMGASIWGVIINSSDQFFISRYFGEEIFADFANGSLELPFVGMIIVSSATVLSPVFVRQVYEKGDDAKDDMLKLWRSVLGKTVKIIYPLVLFCFCFADVIMVFLYGEIYESSGRFFQIKLIVNFFTVISYGPLLFAINGQKFYYNVHMYGAFILVITEWLVVVLFDSPLLVTWVSVICQIGRIVFLMNYIARYFKISLLELFPYNLVLRIIVPSAFILVLIRLLFLEVFSLSNFMILLMSGIVFVLLYAVLAYIAKIDYLSLIEPLFTKFRKKRL